MLQGLLLLSAGSVGARESPGTANPLCAGFIRRILELTSVIAESGGEFTERDADELEAGPPARQYAPAPLNLGEGKLTYERMPSSTTYCPCWSSF